MEINCKNFIESLTLDTHPMKLSKPQFKMQYYIGLEYLVQQSGESNEYTNARLKQYSNILVGNSEIPKLNKMECKDIVFSLVNNKVKFWRRKYRYWLLCDIALILFDEAMIKRASACLKEFLNTRQTEKIEHLQVLLYNNEEIPKKIMFTKGLVEQFRTNRDFVAKSEKRFIVTANVSAGKSTLINAIIGKPLTRTSQEICTGNLCYVYNKPFEDNAIHLSASPLNLKASYRDLSTADRSEISSIASHFRMAHSTNRVCIIDTPGVNSAININHRKITRKALKEESYHKLIHVLNANKLGTDEEKEHLHWVAENVAKDKVVFVLNKLDDFKSSEDSIEESINEVKSDLCAIGYENPVIYPLSSYFAYLIKLKENGEKMTEDEIDQYNLYFKKFSRKIYDLSIYSVTQYNNTHDSELVQMKKKCGLYGLEQVLLGEESL